jgi:magnesium transporter
MLINCVAYQQGQKLADIPVEEISSHLGKPDELVWVALRDATPDELTQMQHEFGLHELAIEDARNGHQRPKIEEYRDVVFVVMKTIEIEGDALCFGELDVFAGPDFVLSIRNRSRQDFLGVRERCEREPHLMRLGTGFVLYALVDAVVDRYFPVIELLEGELEQLEEQIFNKGAGRSNVERLYALKRKLTQVRHAVSPLLEAVAKLHAGRVPGICVSTQDYFRDIDDHLVRMQASLDSIRDTIGIAMQVNLSMVTIDESETTKRLAAWAGIFAVATAFAGIWGMNFEHMPELHWRYGYPLALATIALTCAVLYRSFRKAGWL